MKPDNLEAQLTHTRNSLLEFRVPLFLLLLVVVYGFVVWRAHVLSNTQPAPAAVAAQSQTNPQPHIDQGVISKIRQLQDNSVSVQALFNQARQNPFQE